MRLTPGRAFLISGAIVILGVMLAIVPVMRFLDRLEAQEEILDESCIQRAAAREFIRGQFQEKDLAIYNLQVAAGLPTWDLQQLELERDEQFAVLICKE